jgi:hypothetical protein
MADKQVRGKYTQEYKLEAVVDDNYLGRLTTTMLAG